MKCRVCETEITNEEVAQYAAYGGLPSPCCLTCFEVYDHTIESCEELRIKSLLRRIQDHGNLPTPDVKDSYYECGDHTVLVLKILNSHTGRLFVCLGYSTSHGDYNLETLTESHFNEFYAHNKMTGGYEYDNLSYKGLTGQ